MSFLRFLFNLNKVDQGVVGFDIANDSIKILGLNKNSQGAQIFTHGLELLTPGTLVDGQINDPEAFKKMLTKIKTKYGFNKIDISLPIEAFKNFYIILPNTKKQNIEKAVLTQIDLQKLIAVNDFFIEYQIIAKGNGVQLVQVFAVAKSLLGQYTKFLNTAGIKIASFTAEPIALAKATSGGPNSTQLVVVCNLGRTLVLITNGSKVMYVANFAVSAWPDGLNKNISNEFYEHVYNTFVNWNLGKFANGFSFSHIEKIVLCGSVENLQKLADTLSVLIKTKVEPVNVWQNVFNTEKYVPPINYKESFTYATVVGLVL